MRRVFSILLTLFFGFGPLAATFGATDDARLPVCCRTHGAHHCAMDEAAVAKAVLGNAGSTHFFAAPSHCPLYPCGVQAPSSSIHALAATRIAWLTSSHASNILFYSAPASQSAKARSHSVRGPPTPAFS